MQRSPTASCHLRWELPGSLRAPEIRGVADIGHNAGREERPHPANIDATRPIERRTMSCRTDSQESV
jgi:hypothetical protein